MRLVALLVLGLSCAACASASRDTSDPFHGYADEAARSDLVCSADETIDEIGEPLAPAVVVAIIGACMVAGTWAAEYGCEEHVIDDLCPPGTTITRTIHDTWDKQKKVTVQIPCNLIRIMICGTAGVGGAEIFRRMCAGLF